MLRGNGARPVDNVHPLDVLVLGVPRGREGSIDSTLSKNPNVEYAEPNYLGSASVPNDPTSAPTGGVSNQRGGEKHRRGLV